jgi:hypothetical protein
VDEFDAIQEKAPRIKSKPTTYALALRGTEALLILVLAFAVLQLRDQVADLNSRIGVFKEFKDTVTTLRFEHQAVKDRLAQVPITHQDYLDLKKQLDRLGRDIEAIYNEVETGRTGRRFAPIRPTAPAGRDDSPRSFVPLNSID